MKKEREWYKIKGKMVLLKNEHPIREYRFNKVQDRRRMYKIWHSEIKPNGIDTYELIITLD
jgi:hypothetical protein